MNDGWDDDNDLDIDEGDGWGDDDGLSALDEIADYDPPRKAEVLTAESPTPGESNDFGLDDGWGDDDDLDLDDGDVGMQVISQNQEQGEKMPTDLGTATARGTPHTQIEKDSLSPLEQQTHEALQSYVQSLLPIMYSCNAVLDAEYNTPYHALELCEYYAARAKLRDYTLEQELPRMDYTVVLRPNQVLTNKNDVGSYMAQQPESDNLLVRCANQSLLADVLTALTGQDLLIRSQYLATAVASSCSFEIHTDSVRCQCTLDLSLPGESGQRVNIARLQLSVYFHAQQPALKYKIEKMDQLVNADDVVLRKVAKFLSQIMEHDPAMLEEYTPPSSGDAFRDSFMAQVSKTQRFVEASSTGLSSAWRQIDSVANVSSKFNFVKKVGQGIIPSLPTAETMRAAEPAPQKHPPPTPRAHIPPPPPLPPPRVTAPPQPHTRPVVPHPRSPPAAPSRGTERPVPILGGLLMSGLSRLANTITMPDDHTTPTPPPHQQMTSASEFPQLYQKEGTRTQTQQPAEPSPRVACPPPPPPKQMVTPAPASEPEVDDGWGDEEDFEFDDDDDDGGDDDKEQHEMASFIKKDLTPERGPIQTKETIITQTLPPKPPLPFDTTPTQETRQEEKLRTVVSERSVHKEEFSLQPVQKEDPSLLPVRNEEVHGQSAQDEQTSTTQATTKPQATKTEPPYTAPRVHPSVPKALVHYNPEDDIIETRRRWVNPRPHRFHFA